MWNFIRWHDDRPRDRASTSKIYWYWVRWYHLYVIHVASRPENAWNVNSAQSVIIIIIYLIIPSGISPCNYNLFISFLLHRRHPKCIRTHTHTGTVCPKYLVNLCMKLCYNNHKITNKIAFVYWAKFETRPKYTLNVELCVYELNWDNRLK